MEEVAEALRICIPAGAEVGPREKGDPGPGQT